ncbi:MAG: hypothetical protein V4719_11660 [Planctomycetota bacterium]
MKRSITGVLIALFGFNLAGCGPTTGIDGSVPVTGTVQIDGAPLEEGTVGFTPADAKAGQSATGQIKDGKFTMMTTASSPGVIAGEYTVRITSLDLGTAQALPPGVPPNPNAPPPEVMSLIPKKYGDTKTSGLKASVKSGMEPLSFNLESKN